MNELIQSIERRQMRQLPQFRMGDRVRVHFQVIEGSRRRTQVFEGIALRLQGAGVRRTFTVRKISFGVGVERTFPLYSPKIERVEVVARGEVRRAKLYYLRGRVGRRARVRESRELGPQELMGAPPLEEEETKALEGEAAEGEAPADASEGGDAAQAKAEEAPAETSGGEQKG